MPKAKDNTNGNTMTKIQGSVKGRKFKKTSKWKEWRYDRK